MPRKPSRRKTGRKLEDVQRDFVFNSQTQFSPVGPEDIFDATHILEQLKPVVEYLKNWQLYQKHQIPFDGGVVFYGPRGTGKTLFARYVASVSNARFLNMRKFPVRMQSRVHAWQPKDIANLFSLATEWIQANGKPIVIFLDQFDDWLDVHKNVIAELETAMDGFSKRAEGIIMIVTSKESPHKIGGSLFRRKRIGIHIACTLPDAKQQTILLRGFLGKYEHNPNIDCHGVVSLLDEPTPATIEGNVAEAARLAMHDHLLTLAKGEATSGPIVTENHLLQVFLARKLDKPTGYTLSEKDKLNICIHEIGHAVVARAQGFVVAFVSYRPGLESLGRTEISDELNRTLTFEEMKCDLAIDCAGIEAEKFFDIPPSGSGGGDITNLIMQMDLMIESGYRNFLKKYGLQDIIREHEDAQPRSAEMSAAYEKELADLATEAQEKAQNILYFFGKELIQKIAGVLLRKEHGVMLCKELDVLLEPKLSEYHQTHNVHDFLKDQN